MTFRSAPACYVIETGLLHRQYVGYAYNFSNFHLMKINLQRPDVICWLLVPLLLLAGLLSGQKVSDIKLYDTYFVVGHRLIFVLMPGVTLVLEFVYRNLLKTSPEKKLQPVGMHIVLSSGLNLLLLGGMTMTTGSGYSIFILIAMILSIYITFLGFVVLLVSGLAYFLMRFMR